VTFNAQDLGADAAHMDSQGRVLFNTTLRKELDLREPGTAAFTAYRGIRS
jgi:hypothetical protein